ncbi:MAG: Caulobacter phage CcrSC [Verrucomicrobiota bacterium]
MNPLFKPFPKIARLSRECLITEKIDGTNASIYIAPLENDQPIPKESLGVFDYDPQGKIHYMLAGSRNRWITPEDDNMGFAAWVSANFIQLQQLGPGHHFGEWWGQGIQRKYGLSEKRWSLFNVQRWHLQGQTAERIETADPRIEKWQEPLPSCCHLVPVLYRGEFCTSAIDDALYDLRIGGSQAALGFPHPEGIIVYHVAAGIGFKKTLEKDEQPKGHA